MMDDIESLTASLVREYLSRKVRSNDTILQIQRILQVFLFGDEKYQVLKTTAVL